jgi:hypothetical protein
VRHGGGGEIWVRCAEEGRSGCDVAWRRWGDPGVAWCRGDPGREEEEAMSRR